METTPDNFGYDDDKSASRQQIDSKFYCFETEAISQEKKPLSARYTSFSKIISLLFLTLKYFLCYFTQLHKITVILQYVADALLKSLEK